MPTGNNMKKFHNKTSNILGKIRYMEIHGDMTLVSEDGGGIWAHRVVLASANTLFRDMFQTHEEEVE